MLTVLRAGTFAAALYDPTGGLASGLYLAGDEASLIIGQRLLVDGGLTITYSFAARSQQVGDRLVLRTVREEGLNRVGNSVRKLLVHRELA